jgi:anti-sigma factor (TIGR02949 family)
MKTPEEHHDHREDIGCLQAIEMFYAYLDGEIEDPESIADFEHHLEHCRSCFSRAEFEGLLTRRLRAAAAERAPDGLRDRLRILMNDF